MIVIVSIMIIVIVIAITMPIVIIVTMMNSSRFITQVVMITEVTDTGPDHMPVTQGTPL